MTNPEPISIWQPGVVDGRTVFQRPGLHPFGDHYADRLQLNPKRPGDPARICFFGESAAAGYLLAPHVTPAKALQAHLRQHVRASRLVAKVPGARPGTAVSSVPVS